MSANCHGDLGAADAHREADSKREVFLRLAKSHEALLVRTAARLTKGDHEAALDLVQESVVAAYSGFMAGRLDDPSRFRPWILQILKNKAHAEWRRCRRERTVDDLAGLIESRQGPGSNPDPAAAAHASQVAEVLRTALDSLPPDQRATVELVDVAGLEYQDAAAVLGVAVGTVRSRLARARWRLAALLNQEEGWK